MKLSILATVIALIGPPVIAFTLLSCKSDKPKTNDEVLTEILAEIDRGEWVDAKQVEDEMPSLEVVKYGAQEMIIDTLYKEYGFKFDIVDLTVRHDYDDYYEGYLRTNYVSLHSSEYQFWFRSDGGFYYLQSFTPMFTETPEPEDINKDFKFLEGLDGE
ncbi:MAG: hypothetical protein OEV22_20705 [Deltaproteobacteria bacterium]|nr:hypothetical protein [Deltaproteobacteria bacterium]